MDLRFQAWQPTWKQRIPGSIPKRLAPPGRARADRKRLHQDFPQLEVCAAFSPPWAPPPFHAGSRREQIGCRRNVDRFEGGVSPPAVTRHRKSSGPSTVWKGFNYFALWVVGVKRSSGRVPETLRAAAWPFLSITRRANHWPFPLPER